MIAADRYRRSQELLRRACRVIPLGSQTFSKAHTQFPAGQSPLFLSHGRGGRVWDVDGNEYVDMICGLLPVVLGYRDPDVDAAVRRQLDAGVSFSLATELEIELAEELCEIIPCAEMARFGKNGTDATSAAVRIARAYTGRDHIIAIGYHGWQDWYVGATVRNKGVPDSVRALTHRVPYNDLAAPSAVFDATGGAVAGIILEPMTTEAPAEGYLEGLRQLCDRRGAVLIFDEIVTGFRFALGGAQAHFGVTPDLAAFGKAMGNGFPISAVVGRRELMREFEEVFYSGTFGGEALSIAAARAVIAKMKAEPVIETLWRQGARLSAATDECARRHGIDDYVVLAGASPWRLLQFTEAPRAGKDALRTFVMREMLRRGVLISSSHNICYSHTDDDISYVVAAYDACFEALARAIDGGRFEEELGCPVIRPVFSVRA